MTANTLSVPAPRESASAPGVTAMVATAGEPQRRTLGMCWNLQGGEAFPVGGSCTDGADTSLWQCSFPPHPEYHLPTGATTSHHFFRRHFGNAP